jgi:SH3-like domain-containing protein
MAQAMARIFCVWCHGLSRTIMRFSLFRFVLPAIASLFLTGLHPMAAAAQQAAAGPVSGLPIPRYVSLKSDRVNLREGPSKDHRTNWVFQRAGLPVEIIAESDHWRRIRDAEGTDGWVLHSLLSGRRTAIVSLRDRNATQALFEKPDDKSDILAQLQAGVIANVKRCTGTWCRIGGRDFEGWVPQSRLWGVYPQEKID